MPCWCLAGPVLPGKLDLVTLEVPLYLRANRDQYERSRHRASMTMERVFHMSAGDLDLVLLYGEAGFDIGKVMGTFLESPIDLDQFLLDMWSEAFGLNLRSAGWPEPEQVWNYVDEEAPRGRALALAAAVPPGRAQDLVRFFEEATVRLPEVAEARRAQGMTRHQAWLQQGPAGDLCNLYIEGPDPVAATAALAASGEPVDVWFRKEAAGILGMDFGKPLPPTRLVWDWSA